MKISKKAYIIVAVLLVAAAVFTLFAVKTDLFGKKEVNDTVQITYSLSVSAQGEELFSGDVTASEGAVLFDSMLPALEAKGLDVVYENGDYGAYITAIGGHAQDYSENLYWTFTLNGGDCYEGVSSVVPVNGDVFAFTLDVMTW